MIINIILNITINKIINKIINIIINTIVNTITNKINNDRMEILKRANITILFTQHEVYMLDCSIENK